MASGSLTRLAKALAPAQARQEAKPQDAIPRATHFRAIHARCRRGSVSELAMVVQWVALADIVLGNASRRRKRE